MPASPTIVRSIGLNRPPLATQGQKFIVGANPQSTSAWNNRAGQMATRDEDAAVGWTFAVQSNGTVVLNAFDNRYYRALSNAWTETFAPGAVDSSAIKDGSILQDDADPGQFMPGSDFD